MARAEDGGLNVGMPVQGADGRPLGMVEAVGGGIFRVAGTDYPGAAVARIAGGIVFLARPGEAAGAARAAAGDGGRLVVPLAEERLTVGTRAIALGEVEVRRRVVAEERLIPVLARREELVVQRREPGQPWPPGDAPGPGDEVTSLPLRGWEPVVAAEARVTREVTIARARVAEAGHVAATVRRERIAVAEERSTPPGAGPTPPLARHQGSGAAEWAALRQQIRALAPGDEAAAAGGDAPVERLVLALAEERVSVGGYETDLGEVRLIRRVIEEERTVAITVRREVVEVVRRDADGNEFAYPLAPSGRGQG